MARLLAEYHTIAPSACLRHVPAFLSQDTSCPFFPGMHSELALHVHAVAYENQHRVSHELLLPVLDIGWLSLFATGVIPAKLFLQS